jgi:uncharacterized protein
MEDILFYILIGFGAQIIDGAIGMAYGLISTSILISHGTSPAVASASVHAAEVFTTGVSGYSHWRLGNVDKRLLIRLAPAGMIGGGLGAYALTELPDDLIKTYVSAYLAIMGLVILIRAFRKIKIRQEPGKFVPALGFGGGFLDAIGGGGWGPMVATTLIGTGTAPRHAIGSVNLSEFFVTVTVSATFMLTIGLELWPIIAGLVIGGVVAAPFAALVAKKLPTRILMGMVGCLIIALSLKTLLML